jgi:hypothetical protein
MKKVKLAWKKMRLAPRNLLDDHMHTIEHNRGVHEESKTRAYIFFAIGLVALPALSVVAFSFSLNARDSWRKTKQLPRKAAVQAIVQSHTVTNLSESCASAR